MSVKADTWASGDAYERYMGRWSRALAPRFLRWLGPGPDRRWLDVGCGTGALTQAILEYADPVGVTAIDPSPAFVQHVRASVDDRRLSVAVGDARAISLRAGSVDVAVSGLVLNFIPEPPRALAEMARVTSPGGTIAAYVWDYAEGMEFIRHFWDAAIALDPDARSRDEAVRFPLCQPEPLRSLWLDAGLREVRSSAVEIETVFADFEDLWTPFLGGQGPAPGYLLSLDERRQTDLAARLASGLPRASDGSIHLRARAWAVAGLR